MSFIHTLEEEQIMAVVDTLREIRERVESELAGLNSSAVLDALRDAARAPSA